MSNLLSWSRKITKNASALQGVHWAAHGALKAMGFRWELRRTGEAKLGYWRKTLKPRDQRSSYPKRFVLLPGFGDTPLSWYGVVALLFPVLKVHYDEVILFDFPGFGGFLSGEKLFVTVDTMMGALNDTLDSLKPHTLLGHSLGGWLSSQYAALCGAGLRPLANKKNYSGPTTLLLVNPSGIFKDEKAQKESEELFRSSTKLGFSVIRPHLFAKEPFWFPWLASHFSKFFIREDVIQFMDSFREEHSMKYTAEKIKAKVWLLWGEKDTLIPSSCVLAWLDHLQALPNGLHQAVLLKHSGHNPQLEEPLVVAAVLGQIISDKTPHSVGKRWWTMVVNEARKIS